MRRRILLALCSLLCFTAKAQANEDYQNPVDDKTYVAPGGWGDHEPASPRPQTGEKVTRDNVRLLNSQQDFAESSSVQELADFLNRADVILKRDLAGSQGDSVLMVQFNCSQTSCAVKMAYKGTLERGVLDKVYGDLSALDRLIVRTVPLAFQVTMKVNAQAGHQGS